MYFKCVLIIFFCRFNDILAQNIYPREEKQDHKLNAVLFFAKCSNNVPKEGSALQILEMHQMARVKHSVPIPPYNQLRMNNIMQRNTPNCKELLKDGVSSLVHYCQNALGMKSAVASVSNQEITNDISNEEPDIPPEIKERQAYMRQDAKPLVKVRVVNVRERDIITSPEHKEVFKIRVRRHQPSASNEKPMEIVDVPLGKESKKAPWDVLDVVGHIKFSFFGKMFENGAKSKIAQEENQLTGGGIDQTKADPGLFEIVKSTLASLQETPDQSFLMVIFGGHLEEISNQQSPLIQSIKHVIESTESECTLVVLTCSCPGHEEQPNHGNHENGLNHENHENHNGFNHENHGNHGNGFNHENHENGFNHENQEHQENPNYHNHQNVVDIREDPKLEHEVDEDIPVFAKGPKSDLLTQCTELYDIPLTVKTILGEASPSFGERGNIEAQRHKRALVAVPPNRKGENHVENVYAKFQPVIFYLCTSILFII